MNLQFKPLGTPILLVSDAPELLTGLARIGRDLATLLCSIPAFRVGYAGMGGTGRRQFPWCQYHFPDNGQFCADHLPGFWHDFARDEPGIILSLWDLSRMLWFGQPQGMQPELARFLGPGRNFAKWGYVPVDSTGPDELRLPVGMAAASAGYDRLLAASEWGARALQFTRPDADWLPHGIWMDQFKHTAEARALLGWGEGDVVVGVNMANQARKDWPVAFEAASLLKRDFGNKFRFWAHTDVLVRYWNLFALAADYDVQDCLTVTVDQTDAQLALRYSACDCTMLPSAGEGFGFPIAESMACGTPCVVTDYAAGQELVDMDCRVPPMSYRVDTSHNVRRAVLSGYGFAARVKAQVQRMKEDPVGMRARVREQVDHLDWLKLQHPWKKWLLEGVGQ